MLFLALLSALSLAWAQISKTCPTSDSDICFSLNIPDATAQSGSGDIYFSIQAPLNSYQWIALGQGSRMAGAQMFVMYLSSDGNNVTVSPRTASGHVQPTYSDAQITLLEGSGLGSAFMTANVRCAGCSSWSGGSTDLASSSSSWIYAYESGTPIKSDDLSQSISRHDAHGQFTWDFAAAKGGSTVNPFVTVASTSGNNTTGSTNSTTTTTVTTSSVVQSSSTSGIIIAHAIFACVAIILVLPLGGVLIRLANFNSLLAVHTGIQLLGFVLYVVAFGLGAYYATQNGYWMEAHPIIGVIILGLLLVQPVLGMLHHRSYKQLQRRTATSWAHMTMGRVVIFLGIANGGLGLQLAGADKTAIIAYSVVAGVIGLAYIAAVVFGEVKRGRKDERMTSSDSLETSERMK